jgi:hypothetical protein
MIVKGPELSFFLVNTMPMSPTPDFTVRAGGAGLLQATIPQCDQQLQVRVQNITWKEIPAQSMQIAPQQ